MISIKLNLTKLTHVRKMFKDKEGNETECLVIPIDKNKLQRSTKEGYDNVYYDLAAFELKEPRRNDNGNLTQTHLVKRSLSKQERDNMSQEEKNELPIIGNLVDLDKFGNKQNETPNDAGGGQVFGTDTNDLPF